MPFRARFKVCCIASADEARLAVRYGASAVGLVSAMPSGPGVIPDALIAEISRTVPPGVATFLLTSRREAPAIVGQQRSARVSALQLVDRVPPEVRRELRAGLPGIALVQVVHVEDEASVEEARAVAADADALLLDSGNTKLAVRELGGTGRTHDWRRSRRIREAVSIPVFLAGGLNEGNVLAAVGEVGPFGVDVCSGIRTDGRLDEAKLERFARALGY